MSELPLVSAVIASYNYARFLPRTLDSALAQDYPADRLEIVVVDDGSTDATPEVLADYEARYPGRIRSCRQPNGGQAAATERALREARGELLALLDADDIWPANKTREQVQMMLARPEVSAIYSDTRLIDGDDNVMTESAWTNNGQTPIVGPDSLTPLIFGGNPAVSSAIMLRAELRERILPLPRNPIYIDWWIVGQAAIVGELAVADGYRIGYRMHGSNLTLGVFDLAGSMRERVKPGVTRRALLAHGGASAIPLDRVGPVWSLMEWDALKTIKKFGTAFVGFPQPTEEDRALSALLSGRGVRLIRRGHYEQALRSYLAAAAANPYNHPARIQMLELPEQIAKLPEIPDPLAPARTFAVLATLSELEAAPSLLADYAQRFGDEDAATLCVQCPGVSAAEIEPRFGAVLASAGLGPDGGPDIVVNEDPDGLVDSDELREVADGELSREAGTHDALTGLRERYEQSVQAVIAPARPGVAAPC